MTSRLQSRLKIIERQAAPIMDCIRERRANLARFREIMLGSSDVGRVIDALRYLGSDASREQVENDLTDILMLATAEHHKRYGRWFKGSAEVEAAILYAIASLFREWYGREMTEDEARRELELSEQVEKDLWDGLPVADSQAAQYFINLYAQYPRLKTKSDRLKAYLTGAQL